MGKRLGDTMRNFSKDKLIKGISLVEALVSTAIVAIGFLAVFQLVNYSVNSIGVSGERTKINYITSNNSKNNSNSSSYFKRLKTIK